MEAGLHFMKQKASKRLKVTRLPLMRLRPTIPEGPESRAAVIEIKTPWENPNYCWGVWYRNEKNVVVRSQSCTSFLNCLQAIIDTVRVD